METMKHKHVGDPMKLCSGCVPEARALIEEIRMRRFWAWVVIDFSLAFAFVMAFILFKVGRMGR